MSRTNAADFFPQLDPGRSRRLAVLAQLLVFPSWLATTLGQNLAIGAIFTTVSLARSYVLRRAFEAFRG